MARRQLACGLVLVGLLLCGCGSSKDDAKSGDEGAAPAASQPAEGE